MKSDINFYRPNELSNNGIKRGDIVILGYSPGFSTTNRKGWKCIVLEKFDEEGRPYLCVEDKLGVSWPPDFSKLTKIGNLWEE